MTDELRIRELARCSQNCGFSPGLWTAAGAVRRWRGGLRLTDPNGALVKCRQFVETLTRELLTRLGKTPERHLAIDIAALDDAGVLVPRVRAAFDQIRKLGNKATHHHLSDEQRALDSVRSCFSLGLWFHRAVSEDREVRAFVPPEPPEDAEVAAAELRSELEQMRAEPAEARTRLADATSREAAEARARREAEEIATRAFADRGEASTHPGTGAGGKPPDSSRKEAPFERAPETPEASAEPAKVPATERERVVERAREPEPLNETMCSMSTGRSLASSRPSARA